MPQWPLMLLILCIGCSILVNKRLLKGKSALPIPSHAMITPRDQLQDPSFSPSLVPLDKSFSHPDERQKLQARLLSAYQDSQRRVKVFVFPFHLPSLVYGEGKHYMLDGILRSQHLELIQNISLSATDADVWLANFRIGYRPKHWCHVLEKFYAKVPSPPPPLFLLDWSDLPQLIDPCHNLTTISQNQVHYLKRSVVTNRNFNDILNWVEPGSMDTYSDWSSYASSPVYSLPYAVRTDLVDTIETILLQDDDTQDYHPTKSHNNLIELGILQRNRSIDVTHFWPSPPDRIPLEGGGRSQGVDRGGRLHNNARLRDLVSIVLEDLNTTSVTVANHSGSTRIHAMTGLAGRAGDKGRDNVNTEYAQRLLSSKIVVVAQKDHWEAHHRLMEALISGACVFSDDMMSIPSDYKDGESIVFYNSSANLKNKVLFYLKHPVQRLKIAQRGLEVSMQRHRSWLLMEEVIFGRPLN